MTSEASRQLEYQHQHQLRLHQVVVVVVVVTCLYQLLQSPDSHQLLKGQQSQRW